MNQQKFPKKKSRLNNYARFSGIAFQMFVIIGAGTYLGVYLDKKFPNNYSINTVICSLIAVLISLYFVVKQILRATKQDDE